MKLIAGCFASLMGIAAAALAIGHGPTQARWGEGGIRSMYVVAAICLAVSFIGAIPMAVIALRKPDYIGQAALAGTALRLLLTMGGIVAYQMMAEPHLPSFLFWAVVFYLLFLTVEAGFGVAMVRRFYPTSSGTKGASA